VLGILNLGSSHYFGLLYTVTKSLDKENFKHGTHRTLNICNLFNREDLVYFSDETLHFKRILIFRMTTYSCFIVFLRRPVTFRHARLQVFVTNITQGQ
jgi:hypothetical protein